MSQMQNQQDSATRASARDTDVAAQAQDRALQALIAGGNLGSSIANQSFNQQATVGNANDAISRFNAQNRQEVGNLNTANRNNAQVANLGERQRIADANAATANQQQQYNKQLGQQNFENQFQKASGVASGYQNQAGNYNAQAGQNLSLLGAGLQAGATYGALKKKDGGLVEGEPTPGDSVPTMLQPGEFVIKKDKVADYLKKAHTDDKGDFDVSAFLDDLTGGKYGYGKEKVRGDVYDFEEKKRKEHDRLMEKAWKQQLSPSESFDLKGDYQVGPIAPQFLGPDPSEDTVEILKRKFLNKKGMKKGGMVGGCY